MSYSVYSCPLTQTKPYTHLSFVPSISVGLGQKDGLGLGLVNDGVGRVCAQDIFLLVDACLCTLEACLCWTWQKRRFCFIIRRWLCAQIPVNPWNSLGSLQPKKDWLAKITLTSIFVPKQFWRLNFKIFLRLLIFALNVGEVCFTIYFIIQLI